MPRNDFRGFGTALTRGVDLDGNRYSDFAVGAADSAHALLFRYNW
jgi:hypothetical protein